MSRILLLFLFLLCSVVFTSTSRMGTSVTLDLLIENARIIDGTGSPWFHGDIGITSNTIIKVGRVTAEEKRTARTVIDANNRFLSPGYIDSHTHDDIAILDTPQHPSKLLQGVTTIVTGNCGFSNYPNGHNETVQAHLGTLLGDIPPENFFHNFSFYAARLTRGIGLNVGSLVGHGPLRISVMGYESRNATDGEITDMISLLEEQLQGGAMGLSLGLVYPPSAYAGQTELTALATTVAKYNRVLSAHIRSYEGNLLESIDEFITILRVSGARGLLSHLQVAGVPYWGSLMSAALEKLENARSDGVDIAVDMYPYLAGSSTILQLLPPSAMAGGYEAFVQKLQSDPTYFEILKELTENGTEPGWESKIALIGWNNVIVNSVVNEELLQIEGMSIPDGAKKLGFVTEFEFCLFVILLDTGMSNVIMFQQSEEDLNKVFQSQLQMVGSDSIPRVGGKPHPRMYGSFPRVIGTMAMTQGLISVEEAVRKATSMTASRFGIWDRGLIRPGMMADLVLFTQSLNDTTTYEDPTSNPTGIDGVWVSGVRVVENGQILSGLPGVVLVLPS